MLSLRKKPTAQQLRQQKLSQEYSELTQRLAEIRTNFDFATEPDVIDALIYEENSTLSRLAQLYKEARAEGVSLEVYERKNEKFKFF